MEPMLAMRQTLFVAEAWGMVGHEWGMKAFYASLLTLFRDFSTFPTSFVEETQIVSSP